jgi:transposase
MQRCHTQSPEFRASILELLDAGEIKLKQAAQRLSLHPRQVRRLREKFANEGLAGLHSKRKGRPGSGYSAELRDQVIQLIRYHYHDFGPTFASEKLAAHHGIKVSSEWLRKVMISAGIWQDRVDRQPRVHQLRKPCERRGEIIQIDGSHHRWFEDRGPKCALLVFIDDATSELLHLEFAPSESTMAYMKATQTFIMKHGKPIAFYSDKHTVFRKSNPSKSFDSEPTQFGRALLTLQIGMINAESAQAKGRVERANRTLQDRMIKEMRLRGISSIQEANAYAAEYVETHNAKFRRKPASTVDAHRPLSPNDDLNEAFRWEDQRTLSKSLSLNYDKRIFTFEPTREARQAAGKNVTVCEYPDGRITFAFGERELSCSGSFDKLRRVEPQVVSRKGLEPAMEEIKAELLPDREAPSPSPSPTFPAISSRLDAALSMAAELQKSQPHHLRRNRAAPARLVTEGGLFPELAFQENNTRISPPCPAGFIPRKLSRQLSISHRCIGYVVDDTPENKAIRGDYVLIRENEDGDVVEMRHGERDLAFYRRSDRAKGRLKLPRLDDD